VTMASLYLLQTGGEPLALVRAASPQEARDVASAAARARRNDDLAGDIQDPRTTRMVRVSDVGPEGVLVDFRGLLRAAP